MQVGDPEEEIEKVAQAGIRGMVGALGRETISPHVMIEAALHVLAAWVASSQTHSPLVSAPRKSMSFWRYCRLTSSTTAPPGGFLSRTGAIIRKL